MADAGHPFRPGQLVWCMLPYDQEPDVPGPDPHVTYILQILRHPNGFDIGACAYTTSQVPDEPPADPPGVARFDKARAEKPGRKRPFIMDTRRIAYLPFDRRSLPRMVEDGNGILLEESSDRFQTNVLNVIAQALKRPEHMRLLGLHAPGPPARSMVVGKPGRGGR